MGMHNPEQYLIPEFRTFESFLVDWLATRENFNLDLVFQPQYQFIMDSAGNEIVDFVGRFETLSADISRVESKLGFPIDLAHHNRTGGAESYREAYKNADMIRIVKDIYRTDISSFGYEF